MEALQRRCTATEEAPLSAEGEGIEEGIASRAVDEEEGAGLEVLLEGGGEEGVGVADAASEEGGGECCRSLLLSEVFKKSQGCGVISDGGRESWELKLPRIAPTSR